MAFFYKKMFLPFVLLLLLISCTCGKISAQQDSAGRRFELTAEIKGLGNRKVCIEYPDYTNGFIVDTLQARKGRFTYSTLLPDYRLYYWFVYHPGRKPKGSRIFGLFAENKPIQITGNIHKPMNMKIHGSAIQDENIAYATGLKEKLASHPGVMKKYRMSRRLGLRKRMKKLLAQNEVRMDTFMSYAKSYIIQHPHSPYSAWRLDDIFPSIKSEEEARSLYTSLDSTVRQVSYARHVKQLLDARAKTAIGISPEDITLPDTAGHLRSLSSLRGKVVLLEFWASWCGPCRRENPIMKKAYQAYHSKGFEVFSVSLDTDRDKWKAAVLKDSLPWTTVKDSGWSNVALKLGITLIPFNLLLDKDGKIIAKNLRGEALEKKLEEVIK